MNSLRLRVIEVEAEHKFHSQLSMDGLLWWTIKAYKNFDVCIGETKALAFALKNNWRTPKVKNVLWQGEV
jgi:hypothetical protein